MDFEKTNILSKSSVITPRQFLIKKKIIREADEQCGFQAEQSFVDNLFSTNKIIEKNWLVNWPLTFY